MKNCRKYSHTLPLLAAGDLDESAADETRRHLDICPHCRDEFEQLSRAVQLLCDGRVRTLTANEKLRLENGVLRRLAKGSLRSSGRISFSLSAVTLRAAAAVVIFLSGYFVQPLLSTNDTGGAKESNHRAVVRAAAERLSSSPGLRFSADGLRLIARGRAGLKTR